MPKRNKENKISEIKEYETPFIITPLYNKDCTELIFLLPGHSISEIKFKNYFLTNNGKITSNYESIHFIINGKELNEDEVQKFILRDETCELFYLHKNNKDIFNMYYHIKVILNHQINPSYNSQQLILTRVIQTNQEIKYL